MSKDYRGYLTQAGLNYESTAHALGKVVNIAKIGIGNGVLPDDQSPMGLTAMVNKIAEFPAKVYQDEKNPGVFVAECAIPAEHAINGTGYYINEMSAILDNGILYAYRRVSGDFKPLITSGEAKSYLYRLRFIPQNAGVVNVTIDPSVVWPTLADLKREIQRHEESRNHPEASLTEKGFVQLSNSTNSVSETTAGTSKAIKTAMDNANARLAKERNLADLTNPAQARLNLQLGNSATKNIGTTAGSVAAGDDERIVGAMQKALNGADISDKQEFINNVGLRDTVNKANNAYPGVKLLDAPPGKEYIGAFSCGSQGQHVKGMNIGVQSSDCAQVLVDANAELRIKFFNGNGAVKENTIFNGARAFNTLPERDYAGAFTCGSNDNYAKGISVGVGANSDVGQIWLDSSANLHTRFLNSNGDIRRNKIVGVPIGATIEWQSTAPIPAGFLENNGRSFSASAYPELAKVFPNLKLPDDRGLFKRGLDNGRGIDSGRSIGSEQGDAMRNISGSVGGITAESSSVAASGPFSYSYSSGGRAAGSGAGMLGFTFDASRVVPVASEFRPKNRAVIYITRVF
ncbi:hypothetical protein FOC33_02160 [Plesiomonas shigelloides]|uniref:tail fiber protein n=1 Tax=Plesiomonas shigelloides TaxID=703 RepID=UPI00143EA0D2|nr:tail fiber protein [Plesiomonas shigelloides]QIY07841.1 hypothetical protein FOC33_02160 [Plesiomonas shigelloides]